MDHRSGWYLGLDLEMGLGLGLEMDLGLGLEMDLGQDHLLSWHQLGN